jgi:hypothetical protein
MSSHPASGGPTALATKISPRPRPLNSQATRFNPPPERVVGVGSVGRGPVLSTWVTVSSR